MFQGKEIQNLMANYMLLDESQETNLTLNKMAIDMFQIDTLYETQETNLTQNKMSDDLFPIMDNVSINTAGLPIQNKIGSILQHDLKLDDVITSEPKMADPLSINQVTLAGMASPLPPVETVDDFTYSSASIYTFYASPSPL